MAFHRIQGFMGISINNTITSRVIGLLFLYYSTCYCIIADNRPFIRGWRITHTWASFRFVCTKSNPFFIISPIKTFLVLNIKIFRRYECYPYLPSESCRHTKRFHLSEKLRFCMILTSANFAVNPIMGLNNLIHDFCTLFSAFDFRQIFLQHHTQ